MDKITNLISKMSQFVKIAIKKVNLMGKEFKTKEETIFLTC